MKPLNQAERKNAFLKFLLLFTITIAFIIIAVFFGMRVPLEENKKLKQQITAYESNQSLAEVFSASLSDIQPFFDTLGKIDAQTELVNNQIQTKLGDLQQQAAKIASGNDNIYAKTMRALWDLQSAKYDMAKLKAESQNYDRLQRENDNLRTRINDANTFLRNLSQQGVQAPQY